MISQAQNTTDFEAQADRMLVELPVLSSKILQHKELKDLSEKLVLAEVLKFLNLVGESNTKLTPSLRVDLAWHEFILCTRLYHEYCQKQFGRYIHHHPGGEKKENENNYKMTLSLYKEQFGTPPFDYWGILDEEVNCGSCEAFE